MGTVAPAPPFSEYADRAGSILIKRSIGGIGDVLCHRMLLQDLKLAAPRCRITLAVLPQHVPLVVDHPFADAAVSTETTDPSQFDAVFDTTHTAAPVEYAIATGKMAGPMPHRVDIWAEYVLGLRLAHHDGFIEFTPEEIAAGEKVWGNAPPGHRVAVAPYTASKHKDWVDAMWPVVFTGLMDRQMFPFAFHSPQTTFRGCANVPPLLLREWMAAVSQADYVITLATSMFHLANLLHKPALAIFGCEDLATFGRWFPEMVPLQRRAGGDDRRWDGCPCWRNECAKRPKERGGGHDPSECMQSFTAAEVLAGFDRVVEQRRPEYYGADYFTVAGCKGWYDESAFALGNLFHKRRAADIANILSLARGSLVLDIGTARGNVPYWLTERGMVGYGCDLSEWCATHSHLHPDRIRHADISEAIPFPGVVFDAVTSRECMEHIPERRIDAALRNIARSLQRGGLTMHWIATDRGGKEGRKRRDPRNYDPSHVLIREPAWWVERFARHGMRMDTDRTMAAMLLPEAVRCNWDTLVFRKMEAR